MKSPSDSDVARGRSRTGSVPRGEDALLGRSFVESVATRDFDRTRSLLHAELSFRGLTPGKYCVAEPGSRSVESAIEILEQWFFEDDDRLEEILACDVVKLGVGKVGERYKLSYAFKAKSPTMGRLFEERGLDAPRPDADWRVEQEAYYEVKEGKIAWMIVLCGGYQPLA